MKLFDGIIRIVFGDNGGKPRTPLPKLTIALLVMSLMSSSMSIAIIWSILGFFVADTGVPLPEVGTKGGILGSSFFLFQSLFSPLWGTLADKYGRKPFLLLGVSSNLCQMVYFGLAQSYEEALIARAAGGMFDSLFSIAKSIADDISDSSNRTMSFSALTLAWSGGQLLGPSIGGYLSRLAEKGNVSFDSFLGRWPYSLPCFIAASFSFVTLILVWLFIKETLPETGNYQELREIERGEGAAGVERGKKTILDIVELNPDEESDKSDDGSEDNEDEDDTANETRNLLGNDAKRKEGLAVTTKGGDLSTDDEDNDDDNEGTDLSLSMHPEHRFKSFFRKHFSLLIAVLLYCLTAGGFLAADETLNFLLIQKRPVGLDFSTSDLGTMLLAQAIILLVVQFTVYERASSRYGHVFCFRVGCVIFACSQLFIKVVTLAEVVELQWPLLMLSASMKVTAGSLMFSSSNLLINQHSQGFVGRANGWSFSAGGLSRTAGPFFAGLIFASTSTRTTGYPIDYSLVFNSNAMVAIFALLISFAIKGVKDSKT